jgi:hypothetical protein
VAWTCEARACLPLAAWVARLLVIDRDAKLTTVLAHRKGLESHLVDRLGEQHKGTNSCTIPLRHDLCHAVSLQELLDVFLHGIVVARTELWGKPSNPEMPCRLSSHPSITPRLAGLHTSTLPNGQCPLLFRVLRLKRLEAES